MGSPYERGESYAEMWLEGKISPAQATLRASLDVVRGEVAAGRMRAADAAAAEASVEASITADMEWLRAAIATAFATGIQAGREERERRRR